MKLFFTTVLFFASGVLFGQSHIYKFKLEDMDDADKLKNAKQLVAQMLDVAPDYDEYTQYFTVKTDVNVSYEIFNGKLAAYGYSVSFFIKDRDEESLPKNHEED